MTIEERVRDLVAKRLRRPKADVVMTSALAADLGADSLDTTELVIELESEFEIEFGAEQNQVRTVGDVVTIVERAMGEQRQTG